MPVAQVKAPYQRLGQRAAAALGEQRLAGDQLDPRRVALGRLAVLADPHIAGRDATHLAVVVVKHLGGGKAGVDLDAELLGLARQPTAQIAEADDVIAVIVHRRRGRQPQGAVLRQVQKAVAGRRGVERGAALAPVRDQLIERTRLEHRAGQDVGADLGAFLDDTDRELACRGGGELLQADRRGEARGSCPDHDDVVFHLLALCVRHRSASVAPGSSESGR